MPDLRLAHHRDGKISSQHLRVRAGRLHGLGEIAAAGGEIEHVLRRQLRDAFRCRAPPEAVDAEAQHMIRDDVAPGDAGKGLSDKSGVLHGVA